MDWLRREIAPLSERVWQAIDAAVVMAATHVLAARRIADFHGPKGWDHVAVRLGTTKSAPDSQAKSGATLSVPEVLLLSEIRADFSISWMAMEAFERGGPALDTNPAEIASREAAMAEDQLAFYGGAGSPGFLTSVDSSEVTLGDWSKPDRAVADMLAAVEKLDAQGISGPYVTILDPAHYYAYLRAAAAGEGYPPIELLKGVIGEIHRSLVVNGGALFSKRGGDFVLTVGGDLSVGYCWHDETAVHLFCAESVTAQLLEPAAVCILRAPRSSQAGHLVQPAR